MSALSNFFARAQDGDQLAALPARRTLERDAENADEDMRRNNEGGDEIRAERMRELRNIFRGRLRGNPELMGPGRLEYGPDTPAPSGGPSLELTPRQQRIRRRRRIESFYNDDA